jgi:cytochrome c556
MTANTSFLSLCFFLAAAGPCTELSSFDRDPDTAEKPLIPGSVAEARRADDVPAPMSQQTKTTGKYMREHATEAWSVRKAIISGHLNDAALVGSRIASDPWTSNLRTDYRAHVTLVRAAAHSVQSAATLPAAATALGELGSACAGCHKEFGGPPAPTPPNAPASADPMLAHAAAELALWQGLTFPSDEAWLRGARALSDAPELDSDVEQVSATARHIRELAKDALASKETRASVYGKVVSTCASCHARVGVELP